MWVPDESKEDGQRRSERGLEEIWTDNRTALKERLVWQRKIRNSIDCPHQPDWKEVQRLAKRTGEQLCHQGEGDAQQAQKPGERNEDKSR